MLSPIAVMGATPYLYEDSPQASNSTSLKIAKIALHIIIPLALILAAYLLLPAILLPIIAIGSIGASAYFYRPLEDVVPNPISISELPKAEVAESPPIGIRRVGMNCWINALAQILRCDKKLMDWFKNTTEATQSESVANQADSIALVNCIRDFYKGYDRSLANGESVADADSQKLREAFSKFSPHEISFHSGKQQDPSEVLLLLNHIIPLEFKTQLRFKKFVSAPTLPEEVLIASNPPALAILPLSLIGVLPTVDELLKEFLKTKRDDPYLHKGVKCRIKREEIELTQAPSSLWIEIKRYQWTGEKNKTPIILSDILEVETVEEPSSNYLLGGFLVHLGETKFSGHYISYTKQKNGEGKDVWYEQNDSRVRIISGDELESAKSQAYLIQYSKK